LAKNGTMSLTKGALGKKMSSEMGNGKSGGGGGVNRWLPKDYQRVKKKKEGDRGKKKLIWGGSSVPLQGPKAKKNPSKQKRREGARGYVV